MPEGTIDFHLTNEAIGKFKVLLRQRAVLLLACIANHVYLSLREACTAAREFPDWTIVPRPGNPIQWNHRRFSEAASNVLPRKSNADPKEHCYQVNANHRRPQFSTLF